MFQFTVAENKSCGFKNFVHWWKLRLLFTGCLFFDLCGSNFSLQYLRIQNALWSQFSDHKTIWYMILTFHNTFASLNLFCGLTTDSLFLNMYHIVSGWSFITCLLLCAICYALILVSLNVLAAFTTIYSYPSDNLIWSKQYTFTFI